MASHEARAALPGPDSRFLNMAKLLVRGGIAVEVWRIRSTSRVVWYIGAFQVAAIGLLASALGWIARAQLWLNRPCISQPKPLEQRLFQLEASTTCAAIWFTPRVTAGAMTAEDHRK